MRTRIVAAVVAGASALALAALVLLAFAYNGAIASPPDDSDTSTLGLDTPANPRPSPTVLPPSDDELATIDAHEAFIDTCMADAGFPEYVAVNVRAPGYVLGPAWDADLTPKRAKAAARAMWGDTGAGADYHWDEAGCAGYATHMIGADNAN